MQLLSSYTTPELRTVLAYLNAQPYDAAIAAKRSVIVREISARVNHKGCTLCQETQRISDDIACTAEGVK